MRSHFKGVGSRYIKDMYRYVLLDSGMIKFLVCSGVVNERCLHVQKLKSFSPLLDNGSDIHNTIQEPKTLQW